jgi:biotin carboxyl carrier protein
MRIGLRHKHGHVVLDVKREGPGYRVVSDDGEHVVELDDLTATEKVLVVDGQRHRVLLAHDGTDCFVAVGGATHVFTVERGATAEHEVGNVAPPEITAPMPGKVTQVLVQTGQRVEAGEGLLILEAMKMENRLVAEAAGTVEEIRVAAGDMVDGGQVLVVMRYETMEAAP